MTMGISNIDIEYKIEKPETALSAYVERFYLVVNNSSLDKEMVVIPDGRIDVFFLLSDKEPITCTLIGLETKPSSVTFSAKTKILGVSFTLSAIEYILNHSIADILNTSKQLPGNFWDIKATDFSNFGDFCNKVSNQIFKLLRSDIDSRKQELFKLLYVTNGSLTIKEYSKTTRWSSRQINRYFNKTFGLSLKTYCNILRFRASFQQIKEGKLFPEQNFSDQAHFTREVKKLAGVVPKELFKNKNDRFVQFSSILKN